MQNSRKSFCPTPYPLKKHSRNQSNQQLDREGSCA